MPEPQPFVGHYADFAAFRGDQFNPIGLAQSEPVKLVLVCLEPGQSIPAHVPGVDMALVVIEGERMLISVRMSSPCGQAALALCQPGCDVE